VRHAIEFVTAAATSGVHLYRELVLSALKLVPEMASWVRGRLLARIIHDGQGPVSSLAETSGAD